MKSQDSGAVSASPEHPTPKSRRWNLRRVGVCAATPLAAAAVLLGGAKTLQHYAAPAGWRSHGGPVLRHIQVYTIFVGKSWSSPENRPVRAWENAFIQELGRSQQLRILQQYGVQEGSGIGELSFGGTWTDSNRALSNAQLSQPEETIGEVSRAVKAKNWVTMKDATPVYILLSNSQDRAPDCGYHQYADEGDPIVIVARSPLTPGCFSFDQTGRVSPGGEVADVFTSVTFHELAEAFTDPYGNGWYRTDYSGFLGLFISHDGPEIADVCGPPDPWFHGFREQQLWDNRHRSCDLLGWGA